MLANTRSYGHSEQKYREAGYYLDHCITLLYQCIDVIVQKIDHFDGFINALRYVMLCYYPEMNKTISMAYVFSPKETILMVRLHFKR